MRHYMVTGYSSSVGKTSVATALIRLLRKQGVKTCGFKPSGSTWLMGNGDWLLDVLGNGRLYGQDCIKLKEATESPFPEELFGPNYSLLADESRWVPDDDPKYKQNTIGCFLVERYARWNGSSSETFFVLNTHEARIFGFEKLLDLPNVHPVSTVEEYQNFYSKHAKTAMQSSYDFLIKNYEAMVVESRSNLVSSWLVFEGDRCYNGLKKLDLMLYVKPFQIYCYDGQEYLRAVEQTLARSSDTKIFPRSESIGTEETLKSLIPVKSFKYPPLRSKDKGVLEDILSKELFS